MQDVYEFITTEENRYRNETPITIVDNYDWSMARHIKLTTLYLNSRFETGNQDEKPFKNIVRPLMNLQHRAEGFDVKDIVLFINDFKEYYKSFLVKKYHEVWARQNDIDTFIDNLVETYCDFGGVLAKDVNQKSPEVVPWLRVAFCDQTDIKSGPICEKHYYGPDELLDMASKGWGSQKNGATASLEDVIELSQNSKAVSLSTSVKTKTPSKYIEVYELHGVLPERWLNKGESKKYVRQLQIVTFYKDKDGKNNGITLFAGKEKESIYKLLLRDAIYGRALGIGGVEELFEAQVWTNYDVIRMKDMLDAASKVILQYPGDLKGKSKLRDLDNLEVIETDENKRIEQVNTQPVNLPLFEQAVKDWHEHAQETSAATDALLGQNPSSGTPFKLQDLLVQQGSGIHDYRKGKIATFLDEIYRDWVMPYIVREISKGTQFLAELELDELQQVADNLVTCKANELIKEKILNGETIDDAEVEQVKQQTRDLFMKGGSKRFIQIFKDEMKDAAIDVEVNIAGKQKDLASATDKLANIFRQIFATYNPQTGTFAALEDPRMGKILNQILEASGFSPIDFYQKPPPQQQQPQQTALPAPKPVANQLVPAQ